MRLLRVQPFGEAIHSAFQVFLDAKDAGSLVLTHIYLLLGCSIPLWLYPKKYGTPEQPGECWTWKSVCHPQVDCPGSQMPFLFLLSLTFRTELQRTFIRHEVCHVGYSHLENFAREFPPGSGDIRLYIKFNEHTTTSVSVVPSTSPECRDNV